MALLSAIEIFDAIVMSLAIGYIFMGFFSRFNTFRRHNYYDIRGARFPWHDLWFSAALVAPAILFHELGHKLLALSFGMGAVFNASYFGLLLGIGLKLMNSPFLFFIPAYVSISGGGTPLQTSAIAFAGPFVNLVLWLGSVYLLKSVKLPRKYVPFLFLTSKINMILFVFNMIPIPGFDGFKVFEGLARLIFKF